MNAATEERPETGVAAFARRYRELGFHLVALWGVTDGGMCRCPLGPDCGDNAGKHPRFPWKEAPSAEPEHWKRHPTDNIGIVTGKRSNLFVVDVDSGEGKRGSQSLAELEAKHEPLPRTPRIQTGGGGEHIYMRPPDGIELRNGRAGDLGKNIDTRGEGGYVVAPPSHHRSGGGYLRVAGSGFGEVDLAEMPGWLVDLLVSAPPPPQVPKPEWSGAEGQAGSYARSALLGSTQKVAQAVKGQRNDTLNAIAYSLGRLSAGIGEPSEEAARGMLVAAAMSAGLKKREAEQAFTSGWSAGITEPKVPQLRQPPPSFSPPDEPKPPPHTDADAGADGGVDSLDAQLERNTWTPTPEEWERDPPAVDLLCGRWIVKGEVNVLSGAGGWGKTSWVSGMAIAGATGQAFFGRPCQEFSTVFFTTEDGCEDFERKFASWRTTFPFVWREAHRRIRVVNLKGINLNLVRPAAAGRGFEVAEDAVQAFARHAQRLFPEGPVLCVFETTSRLSGGEEGNAAAGTYVVALERFTLLGKGRLTPLTIGHVGKGNARNRVVDQYADREGSALTDNARSAMVLSKLPEKELRKLGFAEGAEEPENLVGLFHAKHNRTPPEPDLLLRRASGQHAAYFEPWSQPPRAKLSAGETEEEARTTDGQRIREVVRHALERDKRKWVTATMLRDEYRSRLGLPKNQVAAAVDRAVADHWLQEGKVVVRGGGCPLFPDDPERHRNPPAETRPEPARSRPSKSGDHLLQGKENSPTPYKGKQGVGEFESLATPNPPGSRPDGSDLNGSRDPFGGGAP